MNVFQEQTLDIADNGRVEHLTYEGLLTFHQGEALWGASVGFRAMQAAGSSLSTERLWDRARILIVSAHPGPGVRDAIEYVTHCVSRNRFRLLTRLSRPDAMPIWNFVGGSAIPLNVWKLNSATDSCLPYFLIWWIAWDQPGNSLKMPSNWRLSKHN